MTKENEMSTTILPASAVFVLFGAAVLLGIAAVIYVTIKPRLAGLLGLG